MDRDDHNRAARRMVHRMGVGHRSEDVSAITNPRSVVKTYRSTGYWTFVMFTPPWTWFQTRCAGDGTSVGTHVVNATLAARFLALAVASFVLGVARLSAKMLAIQRPLARVLGVIYTCDRSWPNLVDAQVQLPTSSAFSLALPGTAAHLLVAKFGAINGGWVLHRESSGDTSSFSPPRLWTVQIHVVHQCLRCRHPRQLYWTQGHLLHRSE